MHPIPLAQYVADQSQESASKRLGLSQAAICKAIKSRRSIFVLMGADGSPLAVELKAFPCRIADQGAAVDAILDTIPWANNLSNSAVQKSSTHMSGPP